MIDNLVKRLAQQEIQVEVTEAVKEVIIKAGYNPAFGARPLRRALQQLLEDRLSEELLKKTFQQGDKVLVDAAEGAIVVRKAPEQAEKEKEK